MKSCQKSQYKEYEEHDKLQYKISVLERSLENMKSKYETLISLCENNKQTFHHLEEKQSKEIEDI